MRSSELAIEHWLRASFRSRFATDVAASYATRIGIMLIGLVSTIAVSRWLGPQGRGIYAVAVAVATIGTQLANFGLHASSSYYAARSPELLPKLLGNVVVISVGCGGLAGTATAVILHYHPELVRLPLGILGLTLISVPVGLAYLLLQNLLLGSNDVRGYNLVEFFSKLFGLLWLGAFIALGVVSVEWFVGGWLAVLVVGVFWAFARLTSRVQSPPRPSLSLIRSSAGMGLRAYGVMFLSFLVLRIDLLMVNSQLGPVQAGYYSIAATMADYVAMLPAVIASLLFPKLVRTQNIAEREAITRRVVVVTAAVLGPTILVACLLARPAVRILFGSAFLPAVAAFVWLMPGIFLLGIETVVVQLINSYAYPRLLLYFWTVCCVANIALNFWAIPKFGISGASIVSSICYALICIMVLLGLRFASFRDTAPAPQVANA